MLMSIQKRQHGFTIVELLIVVVVIAILATISTIAYNGIQQRAKVVAQQAAATQIERQIMAYAVQTNGEVISLGGSLIGYKEGAGDDQLLKPLSGTPDITMYAVYTISNTSGSYPTYALLTPSTTGSHVFSLRAEGAGSSAMGYRIDTPAQLNAIGSVSGKRVVGNTVIGWLQVSNNLTSRTSSYDQPIGNTGTLNPGTSGWTNTFTGFSLKESTDGIGRTILIFNAAHDQVTRTQVIGWLAQKYGVS